MRYAIIENNTVTNVIEADGALPGLEMAPAGEASIGWGYTDGVFTPPPPQPTPVPTSVSMRQAQLALLAADLLDDVEALVATLPRAYQIEWNKASTVERTNPLVEIVREQKGLTSTDIDNLFIAASQE